MKYTNIKKLDKHRIIYHNYIERAKEWPCLFCVKRYIKIKSIVYLAGEIKKI